MNVLVTYASKHGATKGIAEAIALELQAAGVKAVCRPVQDAGELDGIDAVVLGSAVYMKRWRHEARRFLHRHHDELATRPFWIFSSGPVGEQAAAPDPEWVEPQRIVAEAERLGVRGRRVFAGRVPEDGGFTARAMARNTPPELRDTRDWDEVASWSRDIAAELLGHEVATAGR
jgi:menaquinone-dependent protoporphyrinogen oxidase